MIDANVRIFAGEAPGRVFFRKRPSPDPSPQKLLSIVWFPGSAWEPKFRGSTRPLVLQRGIDENLFLPEPSHYIICSGRAATLQLPPEVIMRVFGKGVPGENFFAKKLSPGMALFQKMAFRSYPPYFRIAGRTLLSVPSGPVLGTVLALTETLRFTESGNIRSFFE